MDKIDRIIQLLEEINSKLDSGNNTDRDIMDMDAKRFVSEYCTSNRVRNAILGYITTRRIRGIDSKLTVREVVNNPDSIRNFGKASYNDFIEAIEKANNESEGEIDNSGLSVEDADIRGDISPSDLAD